MARKKITINPYSSQSISDAIKFIEDYKRELTKKTELFTRMLAEIGVGIAQANLISMDKIETGELLGSIDCKQDGVLVNGSHWIIFTDSPYAVYVEFGTGIVGSNDPHDLAFDKQYKYDVNHHGEKGWVYYKNDEYHWTAGQPASPFMYNTAIELRTRIAEIARKVFK